LEINMSVDYKKLKRDGFTLVEILVAISIFAIVSVIVSAIFLNANHLQQNTANYQRLQNDGRYVIEKLAREIRSREIQYPVGDSFTDQLRFEKDENGDSLSVFANPAVRDGKTINSLVYSVYHDGESVPENDFLNSSDVEISSVSFFVSPFVANDWGSVPNTKIQPRVTILLKIKNVAVNPKYVKELTLQTTVSSKVYTR